jgi:hypothetical protein
MAGQVAAKTRAGDRVGAVGDGVVLWFNLDQYPTRVLCFVLSLY